MQVKALFCKCLGNGIRGKTLECTKDMNKVKLEDILKLSNAHDVEALVYTSIVNTKYIASQDKEIQNLFRNQVIKRNVYQINLYNAVKSALENITREGIEVIVLKGLVLRKYYPRPEYRTMGDVDIIVREADVKVAKKILIDDGWSEGECVNSQVVFSKDNFVIELHWNLISNKVISQNNFDNVVWDNKVRIDGYNNNLYSLNLNYTLIYSITHLAKHIKYLGFGLRQLSDITLFIEAEKNNLDWNYIMSRIRELGLEKFTLVIIEICKRLFGLSINLESTVDYEISDSNINKLINNIIDGGVHGKNNEVDRFINTHKRIIFPSYNDLKGKYRYIKKCKLLIVFAWIQRFIELIFNKEYSVSDKLKVLTRRKRVLNERVDIISWLELQ